MFLKEGAEGHKEAVPGRTFEECHVSGVSPKATTRTSTAPHDLSSARGVEGREDSHAWECSRIRLNHFRIFSTRFIRNWAGTALARSHRQDESNLRVVRERGPA